jgi:hypothetical protein
VHAIPANVIFVRVHGVWLANCHSALISLTWSEERNGTARPTSSCLTRLLHKVLQKTARCLGVHWMISLRGIIVLGIPLERTNNQTQQPDITCSSKGKDGLLTSKLLIDFLPWSLCWAWPFNQLSVHHTISQPAKMRDLSQGDMTRTSDANCNACSNGPPWQPRRQNPHIVPAHEPIWCTYCEIDTVQEADGIRGFSVCGGPPDFVRVLRESIIIFLNFGPLSSFMLQEGNLPGNPLPSTPWISPADYHIMN